MPTSEVIYEGELRCNATHIQSGTTIFTDAPLDNFGKGETFSPTDLLATSLGLCIITIMGIEANKRKVNIDGTKLTIQKIMGTLPRRVTKIEVEIIVPNRNLSDRDKQMIEEAGLNCPVAKSLHPDLIQEIKFNYILES
ncbi:MAG: OsmC family protein [Bacteroidia bacterium]|jgi:putative redox protein|nr:OsmC family protein [Bacteroidia bacterium]